MKQSLKQRAQAGTAIVLSSHLLPLVEELCARVLVIAHGKMRALGSLDDIRAQMAASGSSDDLSLEELFVRITEDKPDDVPPAKP